MKTITRTAATAILALSPLAAQAGIALPTPAPLVTPDQAGAETAIRPVRFDLAQVEDDLLRLLRGQGGDDRSRGDTSSRHGNGGDSSDDDSNGGSSNGGDSNGGNSGGGNSGGNGGDS